MTCLVVRLVFLEVYVFEPEQWIEIIHLFFGILAVCSALLGGYLITKRKLRWLLGVVVIFTVSTTLLMDRVDKLHNVVVQREIEIVKVLESAGYSVIDFHESFHSSVVVRNHSCVAEYDYLYRQKVDRTLAWPLIGNTARIVSNSGCPPLRKIDHYFIFGRWI